MSVEQLSVLDDRYVLNDLVGRGGMADVYRATDRVLRRQVAVKILRETTDRTQRGRFDSEAHTLASLSHPGLITLLDAGFEADHPYLVMELVEGPTLSELISARVLDPARVGRLGAALAEALAYAHAAGVVHRDVKPSNVLVCADDRVLLADFGIARLMSATEHHTRTDEAVGSPAYLAPEQVAGEPLTPAVDVYSLGLVLLEALTGVRAYGGTPVEAAIARLTVDPEIPDSIGTEWGALIRSMTARDSAMRPTAAEVATTLGALALPEAGTSPLREETRVLDLESNLKSNLESNLVSNLGDDTAAMAMARPSPVPGRARVSPKAVALVALAALVLVLLTVLFVANRGDAPAQEKQIEEPALPAGVPDELRDPLANLHRAVEGSPR